MSGVRITRNLFVPADEGCEFHARCLDCPFPICIKEETGGGSARSLHNAVRVRELSEAGKDYQEIANTLGISGRTVLRLRHTAERMYG